jgi:hypothetical protein
VGNEEAGFLMFTPMDDGSSLIMWFPAVTDKEDKRSCRFNRTKGRTVNRKRLGTPGLYEKTMSLNI